MDKTTFTSYYRVAQGYMQKSGLASNVEADYRRYPRKIMPILQFFGKPG